MPRSKKENIKAHILVIDDEMGMRSGVIRVLGPKGHVIDTAENGAQGIEQASKRFYDIVLIDYRMPDMDGFQVMDQIKSFSPESIQIVMTAYASYEMAVSATKKGAFDYLAKPFTPDELNIIIDKALEWRRLRIESKKLLAERERNLLELNTEKSRTRAIIQCMGEGILVINNQEEIVLWNPMVLQLLGVKDISIGTKLPFIVKGEDLRCFVKEVQQIKKKEGLLSQEIRIAEKVLLGTATLLEDQERNILGTVVILRDITQQKRIEELKTQFVTMVSHELRAPISAMHGYIDVVLNQSAGDDPQLYRQMMERAKIRAETLLDLIKDLLAISAIEAGGKCRQIERIDLKSILSEVLDWMKVEIDAKGLQVDLEMKPDLPPIMADRKEMNQVFGNLIVNAVKYNKENGKIRIKGSMDKHMLKIVVEDTGIGMNQEERARCFDEFYRAKNKKTRKISGTGLGLSIVYKIVSANAGRIEVTSKEDQGTRFEVFFPVMEGK
jgi:two-component system phosphate regulon sensor histidine kinase PhoR